MQVHNVQAPTPAVGRSAVTRGEDSGPGLLSRVKDTVMIGALMGAPAAGAAAYGLPGFAAGLAASGGFVALTTGQGEREILLPLTLMAGMATGAAGLFGGWPGAAVSMALGAAYGWVCSR